MIAYRENVADLLSQEHPPERVWWDKAEMELCLVPAGPFTMGNDDWDRRDFESNEKPQHRVRLGAYYMARTPVTNAQYRAFVEATGPPRTGGRARRPRARRTIRCRW